MTSPRSPRFHGRVPREAPCAVPGCQEPGEFRAPASPHRSPDGPPPYRWLCLDHVREFNAGYNYFEGMNADQIMAAQSPTAGWETESRTFRAAGSADLPPRWADFKDPMDALGARFRQRMDEARREAADPRFTREEHRALQLMGLATDADRAALRRRYSELVRKYHPDRNGGDRSHEVRLGEVVAAYQLLRKTKAFA
ncbi:MAG: molecular chaperone DnaJ [Sphingopyxis sp. 65-8]|uniref:DnaJ domain-containing protein n=1 Tax=Sphingopyxis terrae TaxID=33052 RepID=UPI00078910E3|nr:DnaJ domain-containing protein [Sphingopyxis terrae]MBN8805495.1 DnaJ domain-containing protein [Sphingopyxis terrae]OJW23610.1 MAG: molecular chaperone DnaJ [Sphingopyxis sp. 65-8]HRE35869.1 DnaJ domain-containing protein [Sphingopyxis terrae]